MLSVHTSKCYHNILIVSDINVHLVETARAKDTQRLLTFVLSVDLQPILLCTWVQFSHWWNQHIESESEKTSQTNKDGDLRISFEQVMTKPHVDNTPAGQPLPLTKPHQTQNPSDITHWAKPQHWKFENLWSGFVDWLQYCTSCLILVHEFIWNLLHWQCTTLSWKYPTILVSH